jgi:hypothetical protein
MGALNAMSDLSTAPIDDALLPGGQIEARHVVAEALEIQLLRIRYVPDIAE